MPIGIGSRVGPYEVVARVGAGGMGEVYRARDARLHRDVALKVLPDLLATDPDRLARFEREAQALATFTHPHIAAIYGLEEHDGGRALVLELVEGETLAELIARGPIAAADAARLARQIADALEAAHEHGIVHRDLKPANIKITRDGAVKVLDFGLAKLIAPEDAVGGGPASLSMSPTMTSPAMVTGAAMLLGTAGYMAPEQARGKAVDKRADIWAFGVVLYEMLTGARAFAGETVTEVAGAVIHKDPDWTALPASTPPSLRMVVERCLQKDPRQRFRDMGDVRLALDGAFIPEDGAPAAAATPSRSRRWAPLLAAVIVAAAAGGAAVWMFTRSTSPPRNAIRFEVLPVPEGRLSPIIDISPDGTSIGFVALDDGGTARLYVQSLESGETRMLTATDQVRQPIAWSPDSRYLIFFAEGRIKKVAAAGGPPETVAESANFSGASWSATGDIIFSNNTSIMRVSAAGGGEPVALTRVDTARKENGHLLPRFLPDGRHFLYLRYFGGPDTPTGIYIGSIDATPEEQSAARLVAAEQNAVYAPSPGGGLGHLMFLRDGLLMAQPFDERTLALVGDPLAVGGDHVEVATLFASLSVSANGTVIYRASSGTGGQLVSVDRTGRAAPVLPAASLNRPAYPRLSPDGRRLAIVVSGDLWLYDLEGRPPIRLTFSEEPEYSPLWTPDGRRIVFERGGEQPTSLYALPADGSGEPEPVAPAGHFHPHGWTADGDLVAVRMDADGDVVRFAPRADAAVQEIVATAQSEGFSGSVSPDGRWLAYTTDATGRFEVWVRPLAGPGAAVRISPSGGNEPIWSRDGREIFYIQDRKLMTVPVTAGAEFNFKPAVELFSTTVVRGQQPPSYDVGPDGRFVMMTTGTAVDAPITVILNWTALLRDGAAAH